MGVLFLELHEVLEIHRDQIGRYGGSEGIRDIGLLRSAVEVAKATFDGVYLHKDLCEMAAAYAFHIVRNHPFLDGNKRTGIAAAVVFLSMNGITVDADEGDLLEFVVGVASGKIDKLDLARFLKTCCVC